MPARPVASHAHMLDTGCDIEIHAPAEVVFAVLWDVARYPEFLTDVVDTQVHPDAAAAWVQDADYEIQVVRQRRYRVRMTGKPPNKIQWALVAGESFRVNEGSWEIKPLPDERSCRLLYRLQLELDLPVPDAIVRQIVTFNLPNLMRQVKTRAEYQYRRLQG